MSAEYISGACGIATVQIFHSVSDEDRGGIVLRLSINDQSCSFFPHAEVTPNGVDLHIAGEAEADSILLALKMVLETCNPKKWQTTDLSEPLGMADYSDLPLEV